MNAAPLDRVSPLAIALGDPAGIGPEIIVESYVRLAGRCTPFFVVGGREVLRAAAKAREIDCPIVPITATREAHDAFADGLPVLGEFDAIYTPGSPTPDGARLALQSLERATQHAIASEAGALVTAPVGKAQLAAIGFEHPGQTEYLGSACGMAPGDAVMMLAGPTLRTVPLTVHVALADVPGLVSRDLIVAKARIVAAALRRDFAMAAPRMAIAGLNPHSGEGGRFGDEETRAIEPAVAQLASEGFDVIGPVPGDALFTPRRRATYDVALCMYHDQALIPLKALEVDEGVNVTLGLPIVRTSPDHGTAFDIAGRGMADPGAIMAAIRMAGECAAKRAGCG